MDENNKKEEKSILSINVFDAVSAQAKVTFDSYSSQGVQITFWGEDGDQIEERINKAFDILFDEIIRNKGISY